MKKEPREENCFQVKEFRTFVMYRSLLSGWLSVLYCSKVTPDLLMALVPSEMKSV